MLVAVLSTQSLTKRLALLVDAVLCEAILVAFRLGFRYLSMFFIFVHSYLLCIITYCAFLLIVLTLSAPIPL